MKNEPKFTSAEQVIDYFFSSKGELLPHNLEKPELVKLAMELAKKLEGVIETDIKTRKANEGLADLLEHHKTLYDRLYIKVRDQLDDDEENLFYS